MERLAIVLVLSMMFGKGFAIGGSASSLSSLKDSLSPYFDKQGCTEALLKCTADFPIFSPDCNDVKNLAYCLFKECTTLKDSNEVATQVALVLVEFAKDQYDCQTTVDELLNKDDGQPSDTGAQPSGTGGPPSVTGGQPSGSDGQPSDTGAQPSSTGGPPSVTGGQPSGSDGQPSDTGGQPSGTDGQSSDNGSVGVFQGVMWQSLVMFTVAATMTKMIVY